MTTELKVTMTTGPKEAMTTAAKAVGLISEPITAPSSCMFYFFAGKVSLQLPVLCHINSATLTLGPNHLSTLQRTSPLKALMTMDT